MLLLRCSREALIALLPPGGIVAEVGVNQGAFSRTILAKAPSKLYLIDHWLDGIPDAVRALESADVVICQMESTEAARWCAVQFDLVFIDADHSQQACRADLLAWAPKVRRGGLLMVHDYWRDDDVAKKFGVIEAVDAFCRQSAWRKIARTDEPFSTVVLSRCDG